MILDEIEKYEKMFLVNEEHLSNPEFKQSLDKYLKSTNKAYSNQATSTQSSDVSKEFEKLRAMQDQLNMATEYPLHEPLTAYMKPQKLVIFVKRVIRKSVTWLIRPLYTAQINYNSKNTELLNNTLNTLENSYHYISRLENEIKTLSSIVNTQTANFENLIDGRIVKYEKETNVLREETNVLREEINVLREEIDERKKEDNKLNSEISNLDIKLNKYNTSYESDMNYIKFKLRNAKENTGFNSNSELIEDVKQDLAPTQNSNATIDYFDFENKFRGSEKEIKNRQTKYLKYFENCSNVLDIGCGRGEFLELLTENGINAKGVDLYPDFVDYCNYKGLSVYKDDAIHYLRSLEANSLDGVMISQVIEHLENEVLFELIELLSKKVKKGAHIIFETPNCNGLAIYFSGFYLDPTHIKPVHPKLIRYLLESNLITVVYDNYVEFGDIVDREELFNKILFNEQDYVIIGRK